MLESLFIRILNMSLTGNLMILAVLLVRLLLRKAPKIFSYVLWIVVLFRLLCPVSFESGFSLLGMLGVSAEEEGRVEYISESFGSGMQTGQILVTPEATVTEEGRQELWQTNDKQEGTIVWSAEILRTCLRAGSVIWLIGSVGLLLYGSGSYIQFKRKMRFAESKEGKLPDMSGDSMLTGAADMSDRSGGTDSVQICRTDAVSTAFVLGFVNPRIYLPSNLEEKEENYILLHEQIHIRRRDSWYRAAAYLALCLHWFNPFVWLAFHLSGKDMEMSCDEAVIRKVGNGVKKEYSHSLLALATGSAKIKGVPLAFGEGDTSSRIKNVLRYKKPAVILVAVAVILCLAVAVFLLGNPKKRSEDTVYYGIVKASNNENIEQKVVFVPGLGEMEIPEAEIVGAYIEIDFTELEPGHLVRMTFPGDMAVNLSSDMPGSFSKAAKSIIITGMGFDIRPADEGKCLFAVPIGMAREAVEGDTLYIYHHISLVGDIREMYHLYLLDSPDMLEQEMFASTSVVAVDEENFDIWVTLSTQEAQTFLSEFGYGVYCEIVENDALDGEAQADSDIGENGDTEGLAPITFDLLNDYGSSLPDGAYWVQVRSISRSARGIDRYMVHDIDFESDYDWNNESEMPFLAFDDDCNFWVNRELDSVRYEEVSFDEFAGIVADVLEHRNPVLGVAFLDGKIEEAFIESAYLGAGFTSVPLSGILGSGINDTWYTDIQDITGLSAEEVLEEYYTLIRTENADVCDLDGEETIDIYTGNIGDGDSGIVMIRDSSGNLLSTLSAHTSRAGWNNIYLGELEGTPYLLEVRIEDRELYGGYDYRTFRLGESGEWRYIADSLFEFSGEIGYDDDLFHIWADKLEYYLENSHLLLSTQEGEVRTEAVSETDKYNYETLRRRRE